MKIKEWVMSDTKDIRWKHEKSHKMIESWSFQHCDYQCFNISWKSSSRQHQQVSNIIVIFLVNWYVHCILFCQSFYFLFQFSHHEFSQPTCSIKILSLKQHWNIVLFFTVFFFLYNFKANFTHIYCFSDCWFLLYLNDCCFISSHNWSVKEQCSISRYCIRYHKSAECSFYYNSVSCSITATDCTMKAQHTIIASNKISIICNNDTWF